MTKIKLFIIWMLKKSFYFNAAESGKKPGQPMCLTPFGEDYLSWDLVFLGGGVSEVTSDILYLVCSGEPCDIGSCGKCSSVVV